MAVPETPSDKDREAHELTHLSSQPWCSVCVRAKGVDERGLRRPAGERVEAQGVVDSVFKCLSDDRAVEQILSEETIPESHATLGALEGCHNLLQGRNRVLRLDVEDRFGSIVGVTHQCVPWLVRHATWLLNRFQRRQNGATAFENLKGVSHKKPLMQFGERCHWLEAERITHKYDPRWRNWSLVGTTLCIRRTLDWNSWWCHTSQNSATTDA